MHVVPTGQQERDDDAGQRLPRRQRGHDLGDVGPVDVDERLVDGHVREQRRDLLDDGAHGRATARVPGAMGAEHERRRHEGSTRARA